MKNFAYVNADSVETAVSRLGDGALALAGGTDLLNLMKDRVVEPDVLVNIKGLDGMRSIERRGDTMRLGANVTLAELISSDDVRAACPALAEALEHAGTPQIRNMSTLGGNLCARPRCWFYRNESFDCFKRGGSSCPAIKGDNELHAIFATEERCVMVHASSAAPALIAYGARVRIAGKSGEREVALEQFFTLPSVDIRRENVLGSDEFLTHVLVPVSQARSATYEVRHKESHDWPLALASVVLQMEGETVASARICLGGVAPVPWRAGAAEAALRGKRPDEQTAAQAADQAVQSARALSQNRYKIQLARTAVKRAILAAATGRREA